MEKKEKGDGRFGFTHFVACFPGNAELKIERTAVDGTTTSLAGDVPHTRLTLASG